MIQAIGKLFYAVTINVLICIKHMNNHIMI